MYSISARTPSILRRPCFPKLWSSQTSSRNAAQGIQTPEHIPSISIIGPQPPTDPPTFVPRHPSLQQSCPAQLEVHHSLGQWSAMPWDDEQLSICSLRYPEQTPRSLAATKASSVSWKMWCWFLWAYQKNCFKFSVSTYWMLVGSFSFCRVRSSSFSSTRLGWIPHQARKAFGLRQITNRRCDVWQ